MIREYKRGALLTEVFQYIMQDKTCISRISLFVSIREKLSARHTMRKVSRKTSQILPIINTLGKYGKVLETVRFLVKLISLISLRLVKQIGKLTELQRKRVYDCEMYYARRLHKKMTICLKCIV